MAGGSSLSRHALGLAGDDMGDQNANRLIEGSEMALMKACWDYLFTRAQGWNANLLNYHYVQNGATHTLNMAWRGPDLLVTMVLGNLRYPAGNLIFPKNTAGHDVSWTAVRNTPKSLESTVHVAPFHHHTDAAIGAPNGSPFK
jgi:hypothetical protein